MTNVIAEHVLNLIQYLGEKRSRVSAISSVFFRRDSW